MRLQSLDVQGFKSFPQHTRLTFDAPITAIVGPNGSGKSNLAEAFRFVLGEQSMKSMRGSRGEDMIFNGSASHPRSNRAYAGLTLDNTDRALNIDYDQVLIERTVHRDGKHEYRLNGTPVRLKDIRELIAGAHIGSSGHHIISQGETDRVVEARPEERKAIVEDALGLRVYQQRRRESEQKLARTDQNIEETKQLRREIAPRLQQLKREKEKIELVRQMEDRIRDYYREYFAREAMILEAAEASVAERREPLERQHAELERAREEARSALQETGDENQGRSGVQSRIQEIDDELSRIDRQKTEVAQEIGRIEGEIASYQRVIDAAENADAENAHKKVYLAHVEDTYRFIDSEISEAETVATFERAQQAFLAIRESLANFITSNKNERDDAAVKDAKEAISKLEQTKYEQEQAKQELENRRQQLQQEYAELQQHEQDRQHSSQQAQHRLYEIRAQLTDVATKLEKLDDEQRRTSERRERFRQDQQQASELIGTRALEYKEHQLVDEEGNTVSRENVLNEPAEAHEARRKEIERLALRIEDNRVTGADEVVREYDELAERDAFLERELNDLDASARSLRELIAELDETLEREFSEGVKKINERFQHLFAHMFGGGTAKLRRVKAASRNEEDEEGELSAEGENGGTGEETKKTDGLELYVNPPQKKIRGLEQLSGGERSLVSIALLFAMSQINPPPFIILDETDAALDEANAKKYGDLVEHLAERSQLVLITHNRETMSRAGVIYGVTMAGSGASKVLSVAFEEAERSVNT